MLIIKNDKLAKNIYLELPDEIDVHFEQNFFDLFSFQEKNVTFTGKK